MGCRSPSRGTEFGCSGGVEHWEARLVELADEPRHVGARRAEALGVIVEVGEIDEGEVRTVVAEDVGGGPGDPSGAGEAGAGVWPMAEQAANKGPETSRVARAHRSIHCIDREPA